MLFVSVIAETLTASGALQGVFFLVRTSPISVFAPRLSTFEHGVVLNVQVLEVALEPCSVLRILLEGELVLSSGNVQPLQGAKHKAVFGKGLHRPADDGVQAISEASDVRQEQPHVEHSAGVLQADVGHRELLN